MATSRGPALNLKNGILNRIQAQAGRVWTPVDFLDLGPRAAVDKALQRLAAQKTITAGPKPHAAAAPAAPPTVVVPDVRRQAFVFAKGTLGLSFPITLLSNIGSVSSRTEAVPTIDLLYFLSDKDAIDLIAVALAIGSIYEGTVSLDTENAWAVALTV